MEQLRQETEPAAVGLDPGRLARLDRRFARYVDDGTLPGYLVSVARHGQVAHLATYGYADREVGRPVEPDALWRMYSMTKPIASVAALMLLEEGGFQLTDPLAAYLPAFAEPRVYAGGAGPGLKTRPAREPIRIWHLLTHTAGLTMGVYHAHPVDALYRAAGLTSSVVQDRDLDAVCDLYASLPLQFEPGSAWSYSVATNIVGRLIEVVSGQELGEFLAERVFGPLGMTDAGFFVPPEQAGRLAVLYASDENGLAALTSGTPLDRRPRCLSASGGLVASALDYHRFMEMLRRRGELGGTRLLGPRTVDYMTVNHLPGGADLRSYGCYEGFGDDGIGFGLGVAVTVDPVAAKVPASVGEYGWSGAASTTFWVDPREDLTVQFLTQLRPVQPVPILAQLKQLVYQAIVD